MSQRKATTPRQVKPAKDNGKARGGKDTEARILEAAGEVFARFGYEGARVEQIAERAGMQKANIYYYFSGKEALYRRLMAGILDELIFSVRGFLDIPATSPWDRLDAFLDLFFDIVGRYREIVGLAFGELLHPPREKHGGATAEPMLEQIETLSKQLIVDGIAKGEFRDQDPAQVLFSIQGALFHYFLLPEGRVRFLTGSDPFDPASLERRKVALRAHIRRLLT